jgi:hypothetical protein
MSVNLSPVAVTEFDSMVKHAYQGMGKLRNAVTVRNNVTGDTYKFRAMGKGLANQKATSADVDPMDITHSLQVATLANWNAPEYTDIFDAAEVNFDEKQELANTIAGALGRRCDQLIIAAMDTASPTAVGTTTTGLVANDLIDAKVQLVKNGVGDGELFTVINGTGLAGLLADEKISSADYQNVKALVNGEVNTFAGFNVIVLEDRAEGGLTIASDVVSGYAFSRDAIGLAVGIDMKTSIDYVPQKTSYLCNGMLKAGAVVRDVAGLVEVKYDATPA